MNKNVKEILDDLDYYITNLEEEKERLGKLFYERNEENIKLRNNIYKAIELLKELISDTKGIINNYNCENKEETIKRYIEDLETDIKHYEHLLDILRGEDNE